MVTLDDFTLLAAAQSNPDAFLDGLPDHVIIDEAQRAPGLMLGIKTRVDQNRLKRRFVLTGSADIMTMPHIADSLAGRIEIHHLWPLSVGEIKNQPCDFISTAFDTVTQNWQQNTLDWPALVEMMIQGGYPEVLARPEVARQQDWFASYIASILQKDIRDLAQIEGLTELPSIFGLLASRAGNLLNLSDIARLARIPNTTLQRYYALLQKVFLVTPLPAWTTHFEGRLVKAPKAFLNDTGILCHVLGYDANTLIQNRTQAGAVLENFVFMELTKQLTWSKTRARLSHYRKHNGLEVDLVLENQARQIVGLEVKAASSLSERNFRGLQSLKELAGDKFQQGIVLYTGTHPVRFAPDMIALPISCLWNHSHPLTH